MWRDQPKLWQFIMFWTCTYLPNFMTIQPAAVETLRSKPELLFPQRKCQQIIKCYIDSSSGNHDCRRFNDNASRWDVSQDKWKKLTCLWGISPQKSLGVILWGPWMSLQAFISIWLLTILLKNKTLMVTLVETSGNQQSQTGSSSGDHECHVMANHPISVEICLCGPKRWTNWQTGAKFTVTPLTWLQKIICVFGCCSNKLKNNKSLLCPLVIYNESSFQHS